MSKSPDPFMPRKWFEVYPQGTQVGNEEQKFFRAISRHPKFGFLSIAAIASSSGLTKKRVEEIIAKYEPSGIVVLNPKNEEQWGYCHNHPKLIAKRSPSIAEKDQQARVDKSLGKPTTYSATPKKKKKDTTTKIITNP